MSTQISNGEDTFTPVLVDGYASTRVSRNIFHPVIGTGVHAVTLRESGLRSGTMRLLFQSVTIADNLVDALSAGEEMTLTSTDRPSINMQFASSGDVTLTLDDDTRELWWVEFDWMETD